MVFTLMRFDFYYIAFFAFMVLLLRVLSLNLCWQDSYVFGGSLISLFSQYYILSETNNPTETKHALLALNEIISRLQLEDLRMASLTALARACFSSRVQQYNSSAIRYAWKASAGSVLLATHQRW